MISTIKEPKKLQIAKKKANNIDYYNNEKHRTENSTNKTRFLCDQMARAADPGGGDPAPDPTVQ